MPKVTRTTRENVPGYDRPMTDGEAEIAAGLDAFFEEEDAKELLRNKKTIKEASWQENLERIITNDWIVIPVIVFISILVASALSIMTYGADSFIEQAGQIIYEVRN